VLNAPRSNVADAASRDVIPGMCLTRCLDFRRARKERASRFLQLVHAGRARILVPLPVVAEWWRGRTDIARDPRASEIVSSVRRRNCGMALRRMKGVHGKLTVDAMVMATAALADAVVVTVTRATSTDWSRTFPRRRALRVRMALRWRRGGD